MADNELHIVGIAGSLRDGSLNRALLRSAAELAPTPMRIEAFDLADIPMYDASLDGEAKPADVERLRRAIQSADGVLIATPEFNYGVPGVLKNALDWASRPAFRSPFRDKPVALMGATPSLAGTARAQAALRNVLFGMGSSVFPWPELLVSRAKDKIVDGSFVDERGRMLLSQMLAGFEAWVRALRTYGENAIR